MVSAMVSAEVNVSWSMPWSVPWSMCTVSAMVNASWSVPTLQPHQELQSGPLLNPWGHVPCHSLSFPPGYTGTLRAQGWHSVARGLLQAALPSPCSPAGTGKHARAISQQLVFTDLHSCK